ncbi:N-acetyltransferase [Candidatus Pacearchaeota archaeon]|nr:N-acetyltransferase [Candidatus Pacearchaeota archaeon]
MLKELKSGINDVIFKGNATVVHPLNLYGCKIGNNCFIGPFVEIQRGARIGDNTRIQSHSFICDKVTIGSNCFIGHGVMFINDTFSETLKPTYSEAEGRWKETVIEDSVTIGSNVTILPVKICSGAVIGAGSVVTKNITAPGVYAGNPARLLRVIK